MFRVERERVAYHREKNPGGGTGTAHTRVSTGEGCQMREKKLRGWLFRIKRKLALNEVLFVERQKSMKDHPSKMGFRHHRKKKRVEGNCTAQTSRRANQQKRRERYLGSSGKKYTSWGRTTLQSASYGSGDSTNPWREEGKTSESARNRSQEKRSKKGKGRRLSGRETRKLSGLGRN